MKSTLGSAIIRIYSNIEKRYKACFFSALICGLMAHIYALTNHLYNYDELWHTPVGFGTGVEVGRWALSITVHIQKILFANCFTIPFINGFITIVLYALTACLVVSVFEIKDELYSAICGALMTTFPALTCRMFFMFTTHYYAIGIVMVALGAWIVVKKKPSIINIILSFALITYGMAIYQADFVTGVCMLVGALLIDLIRNKQEFKDALIKSVRYVLSLGACMVLFFIGSKLALLITGKQMETYENLDTMGQITLPQLLTGLARCYKTFLKTPFGFSYSMNPNIIVKLAFLICIILLAYTFLRVILSARPILIKLLISLVIFIIPVAVNLIIIMAISSGTMYSIMVYEMVFGFLIPAACLNALNEGALNSPGQDALSNRPLFIIGNKVIDTVTSLALIATVLTYIWFANGNYLALEYTNNHDNTYFTVLMTQIKSVEGYKEGMPVALVGHLDEYGIADLNQSMIGNDFNISGKSETNLGAYSYWNIMTRVLGYDPLVRNSYEEEEYFGNLPEVKDMPVYPNDGSIKIIDDTVVIKFSEYTGLPNAD